MIEEDKYCVDILRQTYALRKVIEKLEWSLVESYLQTCVSEGIASGRRILQASLDTRSTIKLVSCIQFDPLEVPASEGDEDVWWKRK